MRDPLRRTRIPATVTAVVATAGAAFLLAGCGDTVGGTATAPTTVTTTVTVTPSAPASGTAPSTPTTTAGRATATPIPPNGNGYTFVQTKSGKTMCQVSPGAVGCQVMFDGFDAHTEDGLRANGVNVDRTGHLTYVQGNLGAAPFRTLDYGTYTARGWIIEAGASGTTFTNEATGHGMFVAIQDVRGF